MREWKTEKSGENVESMMKKRSEEIACAVVHAAF